jgi:hypothetical protein
MTEPSLTTIIGDEIQGGDKWCDFVGGWKGRIFQRHSLQCRVVNFNPLDKKSLTEIGPDLGEGECKWYGLVCEPITENIYCAPFIQLPAIRCRTSSGIIPP